MFELNCWLELLDWIVKNKFEFYDELFQREPAIVFPYM